MPRSKKVAQSPPLSQQRKEMYCAIGEATTAWAAVEDQLANIFAYFVAGDGRSLTAKAAFHAAINFNTKLAMTDDGAELKLALDNESLKKWRTLSSRASRKAKNRNEIVHFALATSVSLPDGQRKIHLSPSLQNPAPRVSGKPVRELVAKDILQRAGAFRVLAQQLSEFAIEIGAARPGQLPEFLAQLLKDDEDSTEKG